MSISSAHSNWREKMLLMWLPVIAVPINLCQFSPERKNISLYLKTRLPSLYAMNLWQSDDYNLGYQLSFAGSHRGRGETIQVSARSYKTFAANTAIALPDLNQILITAIGRRENGITGLGIARQVCSQQSVKVFLTAATSQYLCTIIRDTALHNAWSRLLC